MPAPGGGSGEGCRRGFADSDKALGMQANQQLDVVEKGLNDFLDTKKMAFPRFYFLSSDELLEILSESKNPIKVQPFVKKCFEAVKCLKFEDTGEISGMLHLSFGPHEWHLQTERGVPLLAHSTWRARV